MGDFFEGLLNFFFPLHCVGCAVYVDASTGFPLCERCLGAVQYIGSPLCSRCGKPLESSRIINCRRCRNASTRLDLNRSVTYYTTPVREALHAWKYGRLTTLAKFFGQLMVRYLESNPCLSEVDCIIPVPLHMARFRERTFNQAEVLARMIGQVFHLPVPTQIVKRIKETRPQPGLSPRERRNNLSGAFSLSSPHLIQGKRVLIIDDVATSGATLESLASVLSKAGAVRIYALTAASGKPRDDLLVNTSVIPSKRVWESGKTSS